MSTDLNSQNLQIDVSDTDRPIVMVDDEELDFMSADRFYRRSALKNSFIRFADGESFLAYLADVKSGKKALPALVLMDINMPRMNGFEVVDTMRRDEHFSEVPMVAMLTSSTDPRDRERANLLGVIDYFVKPFDPREYLKFFNSLIGRATPR